MPHVLNSSDRNLAFMKFMAFFAVTIILVVCAVYVNFRGLPMKRQKLLEERFASHRTETQVQLQFVQQMESARILLDSLGTTGKNKFQLEAGLEGKLNDMERLKQRDTGLNGKLDAAVLRAFVELRDLKKELEKHQALVSRVADLQNQLAECHQSIISLRASQPPPVQ